MEKEEDYEQMEVEEEEPVHQKKKGSQIKKGVILGIMVIVAFIIIFNKFKNEDSNNKDKNKGEDEDKDKDENPINIKSMRNLFFLVQDVSSSMENVYRKKIIKKNEFRYNNLVEFIDFYSNFNKTEFYSVIYGAKDNKSYDFFGLLNKLKEIDENEINIRVSQYEKENRYKRDDDPNEIIKQKISIYKLNIDKFLKQIPHEKKCVIAYYLEKEDKDGNLCKNLYENLRKQYANVKEYPIYYFWHWLDEEYKFLFPFDIFKDRIILDIISSIYENLDIKKYENLQIYSVKQVKEILKSIQTQISQPDELLHLDKIMSIFKNTIYGENNIKQALVKVNKAIIPIKNDYDKKYIVLISNGNSFNTEIRKILEDIKNNTNSIIVGFFFSSHKLNRPNELFIRPPENLNDNELELFKSCSSLPSTSSFLYYLKENNITINYENEEDEDIKLFFQVNDKILIKNIINALNDQFIDHDDFLLDIIGYVELEKYFINERNCFEAKDQGDNGTCYAFASATAIHLTLVKELGDGANSFEDIKEYLISKYGVKGNKTYEVLKNESKKYHYSVREVNETEARIAIKNNRLCVATFREKRLTFLKIDSFFKKNPKDVLTEEKLKETEVQIKKNIEKNYNEVKGHAVVLIGANGHLRFLNSYGSNWGDNGFFRIENSKVLEDMTFYEIYIDENNKNKLNEKRGHNPNIYIKYFENRDNLIELYNKKIECPICRNKSKNSYYTGNLKRAKCPKCKKEFEPKERELKIKLYYELLNF